MFRRSLLPRLNFATLVEAFPGRVGWATNIYPILERIDKRRRREMSVSVLRKKVLKQLDGDDAPPSWSVMRKVHALYYSKPRGTEGRAVTASALRPSRSGLEVDGNPREDRDKSEDGRLEEELAAFYTSLPRQSHGALLQQVAIIREEVGAIGRCTPGKRKRLIALLQRRVRKLTSQKLTVVGARQLVRRDHVYRQALSLRRQKAIAAEGPQKAWLLCCASWRDLRFGGVMLNAEYNLFQHAWDWSAPSPRLDGKCIPASPDVTAATADDVEEVDASVPSTSPVDADAEEDDATVHSLPSTSSSLEWFWMDRVIIDLHGPDKQPLEEIFRLRSDSDEEGDNGYVMPRVKIRQHLRTVMRDSDISLRDVGRLLKLDAFHRAVVQFERDSPCALLSDADAWAYFKASSNSPKSREEYFSVIRQSLREYRHRAELDEEPARATEEVEDDPPSTTDTKGERIPELPDHVLADLRENKPDTLERLAREVQADSDTRLYLEAIAKLRETRSGFKTLASRRRLCSQLNCQFPNLFCSASLARRLLTIDAFNQAVVEFQLHSPFALLPDDADAWTQFTKAHPASMATSSNEALFSSIRAAWREWDQLRGKSSKPAVPRVPAETTNAEPGSEDIARLRSLCAQGANRTVALTNARHMEPSRRWEVTLTVTEAAAAGDDALKAWSTTVSSRAGMAAAVHDAAILGALHLCEAPLDGNAPDNTPKCAMHFLVRLAARAVLAMGTTLPRWRLTLKAESNDAAAGYVCALHDDGTLVAQGHGRNQISAQYAAMQALVAHLLRLNVEDAPPCRWSLQRDFEAVQHHLLECCKASNAASALGMALRRICGADMRADRTRVPQSSFEVVLSAVLPAGGAVVELARATAPSIRSAMRIAAVRALEATFPTVFDSRIALHPGYSPRADEPSRVDPPPRKQLRAAQGLPDFVTANPLPPGDSSVDGANALAAVDDGSSADPATLVHGLLTDGVVAVPSTEWQPLSNGSDEAAGAGLWTVTILLCKHHEATAAGFATHRAHDVALREAWVATLAILSPSSATPFLTTTSNSALAAAAATAAALSASHGSDKPSSWALLRMAVNHAALDALGETAEDDRITEHIVTEAAGATDGSSRVRCVLKVGSTVLGGATATTKVRALYEAYRLTAASPALRGRCETVLAALPATPVFTRGTLAQVASAEARSQFGIRLNLTVDSSGTGFNATVWYTSASERKRQQLSRVSGQWVSTTSALAWEQAVLALWPDANLVSDDAASVSVEWIPVARAVKNNCDAVLDALAHSSDVIGPSSSLCDRVSFGGRLVRVAGSDKSSQESVGGVGSAFPVDSFFAALQLGYERAFIDAPAAAGAEFRRATDAIKSIPRVHRPALMAGPAHLLTLLVARRHGLELRFVVARLEERESDRPAWWCRVVVRRDSSSIDPLSVVGINVDVAPNRNAFVKLGPDFIGVSHVFKANTKKEAVRLAALQLLHLNFPDALKVVETMVPSYSRHEPDTERVQQPSPAPTLSDSAVLLPVAKPQPPPPSPPRVAPAPQVSVQRADDADLQTADKAPTPQSLALLDLLRAVVQSEEAGSVVDCSVTRFASGWTTVVEKSVRGEPRSPLASATSSLSRREAVEIAVCEALITHYPARLFNELKVNPTLLDFKPTTLLSDDVVGA